jgi:hypothetical protein
MRLQIFIASLLLFTACEVDTDHTTNTEPSAAIMRAVLSCPTAECDRWHVAEPQLELATAEIAPAPAPPPIKERWSAIQRGPTERYISYDGGDFFHTTSDSAFVTQPINNLSVGETISAASLRLKGSGLPQYLQAHLLRSDGDGGSTLLHSVIVVDPLATWTTYAATWTPGANDVVTAGKSYYWYLNLPSSNTWVSALGYTAQ